LLCQLGAFCWVALARLWCEFVLLVHHETAEMGCAKIAHGQNGSIEE